ncbi:MAG: sugar ABC transporter ATP-binding protein [Paenibacillaceae bacterium]
MILPIIEVKDVTKRYPGTIALQRVSLDVSQGEVHTIAGENGAGKSTLMKILAGAIKPDEGSVTVGGVAMKEFTPQEASHMGVGIIYQEFNLVPYLTVTDNIMLGKEERSGIFLKGKNNRERAMEVLSEMGVDINPDEAVSQLGVAKQQLVEIAKALSMDVKVLIMDEPTAALTSDEVKSLFQMIRKLKEKGVSIIYISHRFEEIFEISDRITVLRDGQYICTQPISEMNHDRLVQFMVGRELILITRRREEMLDPILRVENLSTARISDINFVLHKGEVLGIAGLLGAGRTELASALFGIDPITLGEIMIKGKKIHLVRSPQHAIELGIGLIPEDRKKQGIILTSMCEHNIVLSSIRKWCRWGFIPLRMEKEVVKDYKMKLRIKFNEGQMAKELSGGNQQKLVVAKALATNADILIFDEPTRGVDIGAKQEIYKLMEELLGQGKSIIMISSEMSEILNLSDRIMVMREGRIVATLRNDDTVTQEKIMYLSSGLEAKEVSA